MRGPLITLLALSLLAAAAHADVEEKKELKWEFPATEAKTVAINAVVGRLRVETDRKAGIAIRAVRTVRAKTKELAASTIKETPVKVDTEGEVLVIDDQVPDTLRQERVTDDAPDVELDLEVHLPPGLKLSAGFVIGELRVAGELESLSVKSGTGPVRLDGIKLKSGGSAVLDTGDLDLSGTTSEFVSSVRVGSIRAQNVDASAGNRFVLQTLVGAVIANLKGAPKTELTLSSEVGSVSAKVPGGTKGDVTIDSQTGKVRSDFPLVRRFKRVGDPGSLLSGALNKGTGVTIKLHAGVGDTTLEKG